MSEKDNKHLVKVFDDLRQALEVGLHDTERDLTMVRALKNTLDISIPNDQRLESFKKEIESLKSKYTESELRDLDQKSWLKSQILVLKALSPLFEQVFSEIDSLKDALQSTDAKTGKVESIVDKREEVFRKIEKLTEDLAKYNDKNKENKDKWREHDTA